MKKRSNIESLEIWRTWMHDFMTMPYQENIDRQRLLEIPRVKFAAKTVNENTTKGRLLDIGCLDKLLKNYLKKELTYVGIDYPEYDLEKDRLTIPDGFFDYVCCFEVLEHLINPLNCIKEIKRVVKDDGLIFISLPNILHIVFRFRMLLGKPFGHPYELDKANKHYHYAVFKQNLEFIKKHFNLFRMYQLGDFNQLININMDWWAENFPNLFSYDTLFVCKRL